MSPKHYLRCLGQPALFAPNGEPVRFRTKKHLALLVYLAVEQGRVHRRDRLAAFFWPRVAIEDARHSLATALSILRPRLAAGTLETTRECVTFHGDALSLDLDRLRLKDIPGAEPGPNFEVSGFLEGFDLPDTTEFALWKDRQQAALLPLLRDALVTQINRCRRAGEFTQVGQLADRLLVIDDLCEDGIRAKLEARALAGDRLVALRLFETWKDRLGRELGASPSVELEQMAIRLRKGRWERTPISDMPMASTEPSRERPFVGRARQYQELYSLWEELKQGQQTHVILIGDSGVGKTTIVERMSAAAALEGATVARVQSYDLERSIPFSTLGGLTLRLLEASGSSATSAESLSELARAIPDVKGRFPNLPLAAESRGETARLKLAEAFKELVTSVADEHAVILVVDDLHLADDASLAVLHLVLRRVSHLRVMAMFTARPGELLQSSQGALLRDSLTKSGAREISLPPLDQLTTQDLLIALLSGDNHKPSPVVQRAIAQASGGYPMVLELLVQDWRTNGSGSTAIGLDAMTLEFTGGTGLTAAYGRILPRLSGALDSATRNALDLASILGSRLNDLTFYSIVDLSLGQTMTALGQLSELRVLRESGKGLEFTNELIRAHAYSAIPSPVRRALHASIADRLLRSESYRNPSIGLEVAWHCMRAGRTEEAIPYLLSGATEAIRGGAPHSAEIALTTALHTLGGVDLASAQLLLVEALQEQGRWRDSLGVLETIGDQSRAEEVFTLAALAKGYLGLLAADWLQLLPALRNIIRSSHSTIDRIRAARAVAQGTTHLRDRELASQMLDAIDTIDVSDQDPDAKSLIGLTRAQLLYQAGRTDASYELVSLLLKDLHLRGVANSTVVRLQIGLGANRFRQGRYQDAAAHHEKTLRDAALLGNETLTSQVRANLALCYGRLGRHEDQLRCACDAPGGSDDDRPMNYIDAQLATSVALPYAIAGRVDKMRASLEECDRRLNRGADPYVCQAWCLWKADILAAAGLVEEALQVGAHAILDYDMKLLCTVVAGVFARWMALTCDSVPHRHRAATILADMVTSLDDYDMLDQIEILCARLMHGCEDIDKHLEQLEVRASLVPETALAPLRACGIPVGF